MSEHENRSEDPDLVVTFCEVCGRLAHWVECPTGGWWRHFEHPADNHDAEALLPAATEAD